RGKLAKRHRHRFIDGNAEVLNSLNDLLLIRAMEAASFIRGLVEFVWIGEQQRRVLNPKSFLEKQRHTRVEVENRLLECLLIGFPSEPSDSDHKVIEGVLQK